MATTIASLAKIKLTGAAIVLLPHGAEPPWPLLAVDSTSGLLPSGQAPSANANAPRQGTSNSTDAPVYGPDATSIMAANADGNADNILCKTK